MRNTSDGRKLAKKQGISSLAITLSRRRISPPQGPEMSSAARFPHALSENGTGRSTNCNRPTPRPISEKTTEHFPPRGHMVNFQGQQEDFIALSEREREVLQCIAAGLSSK